MPRGPEAAIPAEPIAYGDEFREFDGNDFLCVHAYEEVARLFSPGELVVGLFGVHEDLLDDPGFEEELDRAVGGGLADAESIALERGLELFRFEDIAESGERIENLRAFRGVFLADGLEVASEDGAERIGDVEIIGTGGCDRFEAHRRVSLPAPVRRRGGDP